MMPPTSPSKEPDTLPVVHTVPEDLINVLWKWYAPRDKYRPLRAKMPRGPFRCHSRNRSVPSVFSGVTNALMVHIRCRVVDQAFRESYTSLRMLKDLRRIAASLAEDLDEKIAQMEKSVLPVSRYRGIMSLPSEIVVNIMKLAGGLSHLDMRYLADFSKVFLEVEPFETHIELVPSPLRDWIERENIWLGGPPPESRARDITMFDFCAGDHFDHHKFNLVLSTMANLRHLEITASFRGSESIMVVELPSLTSLTVDNVNQDWYTDGPEYLYHPLQALLSGLRMPKLESIRAHLFPCLDDSPHELEAVDEIFDFPQRSYFCVSTLELDLSHCEHLFGLRNMLHSLPALQRLTLRSNSVWFDPPGEWEFIKLEQFRFLHLELCEDNCHTVNELVDYLDRASSGNLRTKGEVTLMTINRPNPRRSRGHVFPVDERVHRVTNRSILG